MTGENDQCPVCLADLKDSGSLKGTGVCDHVFHSQCLEERLKRSGKCPVCRAQVVRKLGPCPDGVMFVKSDRNLHCAGHRECGTVTIRYLLHSGVQGQNHQNPGVGYSSDHRVAYLPDCDEGRKVLELFKEAWRTRMTFTVGRRLTRGTDDVITWNDIHHKTSMRGGEWGYPDAGYLRRIAMDMNAMGIRLDE